MISRFESTLAELRRRKLHRVAAVYVAAGLGVLGVAELTLEPLGLGATRPYVFLLVLLGLPLALVLAWVFELKPESSGPAPTGEPSHDVGGPSDSGPGAGPWTSGPGDSPSASAPEAGPSTSGPGAGPPASAFGEGSTIPPRNVP